MVIIFSKYYANYLQSSPHIFLLIMRLSEILPKKIRRVNKLQETQFN
jgi:hypothetical protein